MNIGQNLPVAQTPCYPAPVGLARAVTDTQSLGPKNAERENRTVKSRDHTHPNTAGSRH